MKKLILICTLFLVPIVQGFSQDSTKITPKQVYEDVKQGFTTLVNNLQGPAKHVYGVYVFQARTEGIAFISACIFCIISGLILLNVFMKSADWNNGNIPAILAILGFLLLLAGIVSTICFFAGDGLTKMINPEYFAIKDVISAFK